MDNQPSVPQDVNAEAALLGSILLSEDTMTDIADKISDDDFYDARHQKIYAVMDKLYNEQRAIDLLTLSSELRNQKAIDLIGGSSYLADLTNLVPSASNAGNYADIVTEKSLRRKLIATSRELQELGKDSATPIRELLEKAETSLFQVSQKEIKNEMTSLESILDSSFERLEELHNNKDAFRGIPTGFSDIDKMLAGLNRSDLIILAARPAMGKSTFAMNIAHNVAAQQKLGVLVFSLEMSKEQLVNRLLAAEAQIDSWNLINGKLSEDDFEKIGQAMGVLSEAPMFIDDTAGITVSELRTKARRELHRHPIGLIVIDYLQLMQGSSSSGDGNRVQEISEISRGLKQIARELNVPVIALSQLSRSVENRTPQIPVLADLRESGSIEQDADIVMFIYREDYYNPETENQHIAQVLIKKHRNGPTGTVDLYFNPERMQFLTLDKNH